MVKTQSEKEIYRKIKILIGDEKSDEWVEIQVDRAISTLLRYLNNPRFTRETMVEKYDDAIILLVENTYLVEGKKYVKSESQGRRSVTYSDKTHDSIPPEVKNLLPNPFVRVI